TRSYISALGAVLFEMSTRKAAFSSKTKASIIAAILSSDPPPLSNLQPLAPPELERAVKQCLAKDPDERWQSAGDIARELKWIAEGGSQASAPAQIIPRHRKLQYLPWATAAFAIALAIVFGALLANRAPKPQPLIRALILPEE